MATQLMMVSLFSVRVLESTMEGHDSGNRYAAAGEFEDKGAAQAIAYRRDATRIDPRHCD